MPALPSVPGVLRHHINWAVGADLTVSTRFFYSYTGTPPTSAALDTYAAHASSVVAANLAPVVATVNAYKGIVITDLSSASGGQGADTTSVTGTRAGGQIPGMACALLNMKVARRYRGGKPRLYLPFGTETDLNTPQAWTAAAVSAFQSAFFGWLGAVVASPPSGVTLGALVNVSYYQGFESVQNPVTLRWRNIAKPRATPVVDTVTASVFNTLLGSQRRRVSA